MAQQTPRPTNRELRKLFVELSDRAIDLAASFQECGCDINAQATDSRDLNAIIQDLRAVRQRVGGRISESPCDETSVDDPGDEALKTTLDLGAPRRALEYTRWLGPSPCQQGSL
jgi:hypothetical protein